MSGEIRCSCCSHAESLHTPSGCGGERGPNGDCLCPGFFPRRAREIIASIRQKQVASLTAENAALRECAESKTKECSDLRFALAFVMNALGHPTGWDAHASRIAKREALRILGPEFKFWSNEEHWSESIRCAEALAREEKERGAQ